MPQVPSSSGAEARTSCAPLGARPAPASEPGVNAMVSTRPMPVTSTVPPAGATESSANVNAVALVLPAASALVTTSTGELVVSADHEKSLERYGPPTGRFTSDG